MTNPDDNNRRGLPDGGERNSAGADGKLPSVPAQPTSISGDAVEKRSFASILDSLRTIEDTFYFSVEGGPQAGMRIPLEEQVELPVGLDDVKQNICFSAESVAILCAIVSKDWGGVQVSPQGKGSIRINGEDVTSPRRLRHGDRIGFCSKARRNSDLMNSTLVFHEPISLRVLPSLLPQKQQSSPAASESGGESHAAEVLATARLTSPAPRRLYFGLFTFGHLVLMMVCTLIGAAVVFFTLNWLQNYL
jgi:hypothetical protein